MKKFFLLGLWLCVCTGLLQAQTKKEILRLIDTNLKDAEAQYLYFVSQVPDTLFPKTLHPDGSLESSKSYWWCSGFYPGTLLYLHGVKENDSLYREASKKLRQLEREKYNTGTHDLGFMMYCSYGNALSLAPNKAYEEILVQSARSLCTRFSPVTGCIRSWNPKRENDFIVIIDNMMNLELLFYATKLTGDSSFYKIAVSHADKTMENHFRPDYSSYHVVDYNPQTGAVDNKRTHQGAADSSAWARGQGWGLYGYTLMYRETKDRKYLDLANGIADFILQHPNLPTDKVPYWDFDAPGIPDALRDASAGALIASALIELSTYNKGAKGKTYLEVAETLLQSLSGSKYKAPKGTNGGFLLKRSVGSLPHKSEVDVPLTYADYYFVEAMIRYRQLAQGKLLFLEPQTASTDMGNAALAIDPSLTAGWQQVDFTFNIHRPHDLHVNDRYSYDKATNTHTFFVNKDDKSFKPDSKTSPRCEMRINNNYTSGKHQFEADYRVAAGSHRPIVMQVFGSERPAFMLKAYDENGGTFRQFDSKVLDTAIYDQWKHVNVIHDADEGSIKVYIDGILQGEFKDKGSTSHYFKCGVYTSQSPQSKVEIKNIKYWKRES